MPVQECFYRGIDLTRRRRSRSNSARFYSVTAQARGPRDRRRPTGSQRQKLAHSGGAIQGRRRIKQFADGPGAAQTREKIDQKRKKEENRTWRRAAEDEDGTRRERKRRQRGQPSHVSPQRRRTRPRLRSRQRSNGKG